jgi:hypothetical protein
MPTIYDDLDLMLEPLVMLGAVVLIAFGIFTAFL